LIFYNKQHNIGSNFNHINMPPCERFDPADKREDAQIPFPDVLHRTTPVVVLDKDARPIQIHVAGICRGVRGGLFGSIAVSQELAETHCRKGGEKCPRNK